MDVDGRFHMSYKTGYDMVVERHSSDGGLQLTRMRSKEGLGKALVNIDAVLSDCDG